MATCSNTSWYFEWPFLLLKSCTVSSFHPFTVELHALVFCNYFWCILIPAPFGSFRSKTLSGRRHDTFKRLYFLYMLPPCDLMKSITLQFSICSVWWMLYVITVTNVIFVIQTDETLNQLISQCSPMDGGNEWVHCFILVHHTLALVNGSQQRSVLFNGTMNC